MGKTDMMSWCQVYGEGLRRQGRNQLKEREREGLPPFLSILDTGWFSSSKLSELSAKSKPDNEGWSRKAVGQGGLLRLDPSKGSQTMPSVYITNITE